MLNLTKTVIFFADAVLRAFVDLDQGQRDKVTLLHAGGGTATTLTVWGIWIGDTFSWRVAQDDQGKAGTEGGTEIFAGTGASDDVYVAASRLCWALGGVAEGETGWSLQQ